MKMLYELWTGCVLSWTGEKRLWFLAQMRSLDTSYTVWHSVLGPLQYILYTGHLNQLIVLLREHGPSGTLMTYICTLHAIYQTRLCQAIVAEVQSWMSSNLLRPFPTETQYIWVRTFQRFMRNWLCCNSLTEFNSLLSTALVAFGQWWAMWTIFVDPGLPVVPHASQMVLSVFQRCSDRCSLTHRDVLGLFEFCPCQAPKVPVVPDQVIANKSKCSQQIKMYAYTGNGIYARNDTPACSCKVYCLRDHHADLCFSCLGFHQGALCFSPNCQIQLSQQTLRSAAHCCRSTDSSFLFQNQWHQRRLRWVLVRPSHWNEAWLKLWQEVTFF